MRLLATFILGLAIICGEVYLGIQTFYPEAHTSAQVDIVDELIKEKKTLVDQIPQAELAWIANNPTVVLGADPSFYPLETFDERGQYTGLGGDYMRLLSHLTGINFQVLRQGDWATSEELAQQSKVDMFMAIGETERRKQFMKFTEHYINLPGMIMIRRDNNVDQMAIPDLYGKRVVVVQNYFWHDYLLDNHPKLDLLEAKNTSEALQMVTDGTADAVIDYGFNLLEKMQVAGIFQVKTVGTVQSENGHAIAVRNDLPELYNIVNVALASISVDERKSLADKWLYREKPAGLERRAQWYFFFFTQAMLLCLGILTWNKSCAKKAVKAKLQSIKKKELA